MGNEQLREPGMTDHEQLREAGVTDPEQVATSGDFGRELSLARERTGLTVRQAARLAGIPVSTVGDYFGSRRCYRRRDAARSCRSHRGAPGIPVRERRGDGR
jgi:hypothetical protein